MRTIAKAPEWVLGSAPMFGNDMMVSIGASNQIKLIDINTALLKVNLATVTSPQRLEWDGHTHMYAISGNTIARVNVKTLAVDSTINLSPNIPTSMAHDSSYVYVSTNNDIVRISVSTGTLDITEGFTGNNVHEIFCDGNYLCAEFHYGGDGYGFSIQASLTSNWPLYFSTDPIDTQGTPFGMAKDDSGHMYVTLYGRVLRYVITTGVIDEVIDLIYNGIVMTNAYGIAWDGSNHMYVTNVTGKVFLINITTGFVDRVIDTGGSNELQGIAWDGGSYMYAVNVGGINFVRISISSGAFTSTNMSITQPTAIAWDGASHMFAISQYGPFYGSSNPQVSIIDTSTGTEVGTVVLDFFGNIYSPMPFDPRAIAWDGGSYMYMTGFNPAGGATYYLVMDRNGTLITSSPVSLPTGPVFTPTYMGIAWDGGSYMYMSGRVGISRRLVNNAYEASPLDIAIPNTTYNLPSLAFDGYSHIWSTVSGSSGSVISKILKSSGSIDQTFAPTVNDFVGGMCSTSDGYLYASDTGTHVVYKNTSPAHFYYNPGQSMFPVQVGNNPQRMAWDGYNHVYVTNSADGTVSRIHRYSDVVDATITVGTTPYEIAWDGANHMYVNNRGSNNVSRILVSSGAIDATVSLSGVPTGLAWDGPLRKS